uniref:Uncharacterized protein n=1 Tax=Molossus molossus TaxID=27622 RepID=A0A7J8I8E9_MOLMO|nr:hypothetical protein HJG59_010657 [Molossus molossus]
MGIHCNSFITSTGLNYFQNKKMSEENMDFLTLWSVCSLNTSIKTDQGSLEKWPNAELGLRKYRTRKRHLTVPKLSSLKWRTFKISKVVSRGLRSPPKEVPQATSQGTPGAIRSWKRQEGSCPRASEGVWPCCCLDLRLLTSITGMDTFLLF